MTGVEKTLLIVPLLFGLVLALTCSYLVPQISLNPWRLAKRRLRRRDWKKVGT